MTFEQHYGKKLRNDFRGIPRISQSFHNEQSWIYGDLDHHRQTRFSGGDFGGIDGDCEVCACCSLLISRWQFSKSFDCIP